MKPILPWPSLASLFIAFASLTLVSGGPISSEDGAIHPRAHLDSTWGRTINQGTDHWEGRDAPQPVLFAPDGW